MIDFRFLSSAATLLMTISILTPSPEAMDPQVQRCFPAASTCFRFYSNLDPPPNTTDDADALCRSTGGKLLELRNDAILQDFRTFAVELQAMTKTSKFFINLKRIPNNNRWMWLRYAGDGKTNLHPARTLPTGLSGSINNGGCAFAKKTDENFVKFGAAPCNKSNSYLCKNGHSQTCLQSTCYQIFSGLNWIEASQICHLVSVLDSGESLQDQDSSQVQEFETKVLSSLTRLLVGHEAWIGLTKYYWAWNSTGDIVDEKLLQWNWEPPGSKDGYDCLLKLSDLTIVPPSEGIAWGIICTEDYNPSQSTITNVVVVQEQPSSSSPSSSSSSTTTTTTTTSTTSSSLSTTSIEPPSLLSSSLSSSSSSPSTTVLLLPLPETTLTPQLPPATTTTSASKQDNWNSEVTMPLIVGIALGVLITFFIALLIFKVTRKKAKLKESEATQEFRFSTVIPKSEDPSKDDNDDDDVEIVVLGSAPDILMDGTASFSTKILRSITSGDQNQVRPVTPTATSLDAPTMFKNYENFPDFSSSFT